MGIVETLLELFFIHVVYPIALDLIMKRELNPEFKKESDEVFSLLDTAGTTEARKLAARKLYELQKKYKS